MSGDPYESEEYQRFLAETAKECRSCDRCWDVPCPACCAGGICDAICNCDRDGYYDEASLEQEEDDYDAD